MSAHDFYLRNELCPVRGFNELMNRVIEHNKTVREDRATFTSTSLPVTEDK